MECLYGLVDGLWLDVGIGDNACIGCQLLEVMLRRWWSVDGATC